MTKSVDHNKARQGRSGRPVLIVLISALVLVMVVWAGVAIFGNAIEPANPVGGEPAQQPAEAVQE